MEIVGPAKPSKLLSCSLFILVLSLVFVDPRYRFFGIPYYDYVAVVTFLLLLDPRYPKWSTGMVVYSLLLLVSVTVLGNPLFHWSYARGQAAVSELFRILGSIVMFMTGWISIRNYPQLYRVIALAWLATAASQTPVLLSAITSGARFSGTFADPNYYGSYLASVALALIAGLWSPQIARRTEVRLFAVLSILVLGVSVFLSFSRAAVLGLVLGVIALFVIAPSWSLRSRFQVLVIVVCVVLVLIIVAPYIPGVSRHLARLQLTSAIESGGSGRLEIWSAVLDEITRHPFGLSWDARVEVRGVEKVSHNFILEMGLRFGVVGLVVGAMFFVAFLNCSLFVLRRGDAHFRSFGVMGLVMLVACTTLDVLAWRHFWLALGFLGGAFDIVKAVTGAHGVKKVA